MGDLESSLQRYKNLLKNRVFLGHFQEKRLVERLNTYKDLVVLGSDEKEFCLEVQLAANQIRSVYGPDIWVGFTGPDVVGAPAGNCIWATIKATVENVTFGQYWFQVCKFIYPLVNEVVKTFFLLFFRLKLFDLMARKLKFI